MAVKEVTLFGNPILRKKCRAVTDFKTLEPIVQDMLDTMYEKEGIGLAANQIGLDMNLMIVDVTHTEEADEPLVIVNSTIIEKSGESVLEEGCLSLPEIRFDVKRAETIRLSFQTLDGAVKTETFEGLTARVIQHETDHLNGWFIIDRTSPLVKMKFSNELKEIELLSHSQLIQ